MSSNDQIHRNDTSRTNEEARHPDGAGNDHPTQDLHLGSIVQRATQAPRSLTLKDAKQLQRAFGNRAVARLMGGTGSTAAERSPGGAGIQPRRDPGQQGVVQRLADLAAFKEKTHLDWRMRWKVKAIDREITAYHKLSMENYRGRVATLQRIVSECNNYLNRSDSAAKRKAGVEWLLPQATQEKEIFTQLLAASTAGDRKTRYHILVRAQDAVTRVEAAGVDVQAIHNHINQQLGQVITEIRGAEPELIKELLQEDLAQLRDLMQEPTVPDMIRQVLQEVLANEGRIDFREGVPGARLSKPSEQLDKAYVLNHALKPSEGLGTAERLGSLVHEMTHVSAGESFNNTSAFLLFDPALPSDAIIDLAKDRKQKVETLRNLIEADPNFSPKQKDLLRSKLQYAQDNKVLLYAARFSDAANHKKEMAIKKLEEAANKRAEDNGNDPAPAEYQQIIDELKKVDKGIPDESVMDQMKNKPGDQEYQEGLAYQQIADKLKAVATAVPEGNNTLIEYDSVMNQMLIYMHFWGIPQDNQCYQTLNEMADEAYQSRDAAQGGP